MWPMDTLLHRLAEAARAYLETRETYDAIHELPIIAVPPAEADALREAMRAARDELVAALKEAEQRVTKL